MTDRIVITDECICRRCEWWDPVWQGMMASTQGSCTHREAKPFHRTRKASDTCERFSLDVVREP